MRATTAGDFRRRFENEPRIHLPCRIVRTGRRIVYRLPAWNPWAGTLIRLSEAMRLPMKC